MMRPPGEAWHSLCAFPFLEAYMNCSYNIPVFLLAFVEHRL